MRVRVSVGVRLNAKVRIRIENRVGGCGEVRND
jgi:hypothetical protein